MSENPPQNDNALNEAPGIAWTTLYTKTGGKINLTIRAFSGREALDELVETVIYAKEKYHFDLFGMSEMQLKRGLRWRDKISF